MVRKVIDQRVNYLTIHYKMEILWLIFGIVGLYVIGKAFADETIEEIRKQNKQQ